MADLQDNDKFLVNRSGKSYQVTKDNLMAELKDDDLLLVNRANKSYKITGAEFKESVEVNAPPFINTVELEAAPSTDYRFTNREFTTTVTMITAGKPEAVKSIRGWVEGTLLTSTSLSNAVNVSTDIVDFSGSSVGQDSTNETEARNILTSSTSEYFGYANNPGGQKPDRQKIWQFNNPIPIFPGETIEVFGYCGGCFRSALEFTNGTSFSTTVCDDLGAPNYTCGSPKDPLVVTNEGSISAIRSGRWGVENQFSKLYYIKINGEIWTGDYQAITLTNSDGLTDFSPGDKVVQFDPDSGLQSARGVIVDIATGAQPVLTVRPEFGPFVQDRMVEGEPIAQQNAKKYLQLNSNLDVLGLTDDDSYTRTPGNVLVPKIQFPLILNNGQTPDESIAVGATIQTEFKAENGGGTDEKVSNILQPEPPSANVRYILGNWANGISGMERSFDSGYFNLPIEQNSHLLVIDNRAGVRGGADGGGGGNGGSTGATGGSKGERIRGAIYCVLRDPVVVRVLETGAGGTILRYQQMNEPKGITDIYADGTSTAVFEGGSGSGFSVKFTKDENKIGLIDTVEDGGSGYNVGDNLTWTAPIGKGQNKDLDSDWDKLVHGVALSAGGSGGRGANGEGQGAGAPKTPVWDGDGVKGANGGGPHGTNGTGGAGGVRDSTLYSTSERGGNNRGGQCGGGGGSGAGFGGGKGGQGGAESGGTHGTGGGGGSGASYLWTEVVTDGAGSGANVTGVQVYIDKVLVDSVDDTVKSFPLAATGFNSRRSSAGVFDLDEFNAIKDGFDDYAAERAQYRADLRQRLIDAGFSQEEMSTMLLVDDGEVAFAKEGYFPLYLTEAEANNASTNGSSHAHTIEGETFYMPDAGVTLYHGTYGMAPEDTAAGTADIIDVADNTDTTGTADISDDDSGDSSY